MARSRIAAALFIASLAAACTAAATTAPSAVPAASLATGTPSGSPSASPSGSPNGSPTGPGDSGGRPSIPAVSLPAGSPVVALPAAVLDPVLADASARSGVPRAELVVVTAASRTWSDGSLGCPAPGVFYTQALVEGYQVIVRAGTTLYDYRGAGMTTFKLCKTIP